ncbi:MAG: transketolase family protein [Saccharofermentanales bacterium]
MGKTATREAYGLALAEFGSDERIVVLDADLSKSTYTVTFKKVFPERHFNMGIAEANMVSAACGMATCGKIAFASTFAIFASERACEQIRNSACYPKLNVKVCATHAGISVGEDGASHQCIEDLAIMRSLPNLTVVQPCDAASTRACIRAAIDTEGPFYVRLGRLAVEDVYNSEDIIFKIGKANVLRAGSDVTIIASGLMVQEALKAAAALSEEGIDAGVVDMHTIKPIDRDLIIAAAKETGAIVTAEEHSIIGGLGGAVAEVIATSAPCVLRMVGVQDKFGKSGKPAELLEEYGLTAAAIMQKAKEAIAVKKTR